MIYTARDKRLLVLKIIVVVLVLILMSYIITLAGISIKDAVEEAKSRDANWFDDEYRRMIGG